MNKNRILLIIQAVFCVLSALVLIAADLSIYFEGLALKEDDPMAAIYSVEAVAEKAVFVVPVLLAAVIVTIICSILGAKVKEYKSHIQDALDGKAPSYVSETNSYESSNNYYRIIVADQTSAPVEGAMVQFCTDDTCKMGVTDSTGAVTFDDPPGVYEVHVRKLPEGYKANDTTYKTESYYSDMVITVGKK